MRIPMVDMRSQWGRGNGRGNELETKPETGVDARCRAATQVDARVAVAVQNGGYPY
jgi:hypothetical protein